MKREGKRVILVRPMTTPDDVHGMVAAEGILTSQGGATSHAAVVARGMGKPAVVGCEALLIDLRARQFVVKERALVHEGDPITIDGTTGNVYLGELQMQAAKLSPQFRHVLQVGRRFQGLGVLANADTPEDALRRRAISAPRASGLCRTEHMFMQTRAAAGRARDDHGRDARLAAQVPRAAAADAARGLPRHLPGDEGLAGHGAAARSAAARVLAQSWKTCWSRRPSCASPKATPRPSREERRLLRRVRALHESNPMLGLRVCRLGIVYPEIYQMQVRAIIEAAVERQQREDRRPSAHHDPGRGHGDRDESASRPGRRTRPNGSSRQAASRCHTKSGR